MKAFGWAAEELLAPTYDDWVSFHAHLKLLQHLVLLPDRPESGFSS